jgi:PleD family two-component response regulator
MSLIEPVSSSPSLPFQRVRAAYDGAASLPSAARDQRRAPSGGHADLASVLGIPQGELTPAVRTALAGLLSEAGALKAENQALADRLRQAEGLADIDPLADVLNRRAFLRESARSMSFAARHGSPASMLYFDLNGFKQINDRN